ncbi:uncharacterized protein CBL_06438 [Carabus blaptoides fortunei]
MANSKLKYFVLFLVILELNCLGCVGYRIKNVTSDELDISTESTIENINTQEQCINGHSTLKNTFHWEDYAVLTTMLVISCGIGLFYGFIGPKQATSSDFLLGGSSMGTFPMAMSLAASFITAIELLGNPAEMYNYGSQFWMICVSFVLIVPITSKLYLPVFMDLKLTSSYEYLSRRFSVHARYLASGLYVLQMVLYTSVAVYAPALALSHVTGLNTYIAVTVVYVVCIFYASQGGMKAVIMTDTFQAAVLLGSIILVLLLGEQFIGGPEIIWSENWKSKRLEIFNMDPNPTVRHSFWSVVIGGTFYWMTMFASNQASIQKYMSVETLSQARSALWVSAAGLVLVYTINFYTGMIMVAHYSECDPLRAGDITASDQLLPLYIINNFGHLRGVTGFFVAGIFAASLGTVASALNSLAAVTCQDFINGALGITLPEKKGALYAKWISIAYGAISFGLVFIVEQLGGVMQVALSFNGMVGGVTLGLFSLGMFFPWANSKGAITGAITAMVLVMWMGLGNQISQARGDLVFEVKRTSIEDCPCLNSTAFVQDITDHSNDEVFFLYRISYLWYSFIGFTVTILIGMVISFITGAQNPKDVDNELLSPPIRKLIDSLSTSTKEILNLPLKVPTNCRNVTLLGIVNRALDMNDEKVHAEANNKDKNEQTKS